MQFYEVVCQGIFCAMERVGVASQRGYDVIRFLEVERLPTRWRHGVFIFSCSSDVALTKSRSLCEIRTIIEFQK